MKRVEGEGQMLGGKNADLTERFADSVPVVVTEVLVALAMIALAIGLRLAIDIFFQDVVVFSLIFPAVVGATLLAGPRSGAIVVAGCQLIAWYVLLPVQHSFRFATWGNLASLVLTTLAELLMLWFVASYRKAARAAAETEKRRANMLDFALRELDHRTKNNFQIAGALLNLHASRSDLPQVKEELAAAANRLTSISAIHDHLAVGRSNMTCVALKDYLEEVCGHLRGGLTDESVIIATDIAAVEIAQDSALHLGLIVNELVTNAVKHAFDGEGGWINVKARVEDETLVLLVSDNGRGSTIYIPDAKGIGAKLIQMLALAIDGEVRCTSGPGTNIEIRVPIGADDGRSDLESRPRYAPSRPGAELVCWI